MLSCHTEHLSTTCDYSVYPDVTVFASEDGYLNDAYVFALFSRTTRKPSGSSLNDTGWSGVVVKIVHTRSVTTCVFRGVSSGMLW